MPQPLTSGIFDINGVDIKSGDTVRLTIQVQHSKPVIALKEVIYYKGAFRFKNEREFMQSCIGDISWNCSLEVIKQ